jgi:hypothetical protein
MVDGFEQKCFNDRKITKANELNRDHLALCVPECAKSTGQKAGLTMMLNTMPGPRSPASNCLPSIQCAYKLLRAAQLEELS